MEAVSSVEAFLAMYWDRPELDSTAAEILSELEADERAVLMTARRDPQNRRPASCIEDQAYVHLRRALQRRGLFRS